MMHTPTTYNPNTDHYAVGAALNPLPHRSSVLVQLQENGGQARVPLTPAEARNMAQCLLTVADLVDAHLREEAAIEAGRAPVNGAVGSC